MGYGTFVVLAALVVAIAAFVVLRPDDDSAPSAQTTAPATTAEQHPATTPAAGEQPGAARPSARPRPRPRPQPRFVEIVARGLEPVGGVKQVELRKGDTIRLAIRSDQPEEVHLHGYDDSVDVVPGRTARLVVPAEIEGIFEVEFEHSGVPIAEITINP